MKINGVLTVQPPRLAALLMAGPMPEELSFFRRLLNGPQLTISFEELFALPMHIVDMVARLENICEQSKEILSSADGPRQAENSVAQAPDHGQSYEAIVSMLQAFCKAATGINECAEIFNAAGDHPNTLLRLNEPEAPEQRVIDAWTNWIVSMESEIGEQQMAFRRARDRVFAERACRAAAFIRPTEASATPGHDSAEPEHEHKIVYDRRRDRDCSDDASGSPKRPLDTEASVQYSAAKRLATEDDWDV